MRCANFVLKHSRKDQNRSNGLNEIEFSQRLVYQVKNGKPESKQGVQEYTLISLITQRSKVQILPPATILVRPYCCFKPLPNSIYPTLKWGGTMERRSRS